MKLRYQEEAKEWRKSALLTLFGLALIATVLHWRRYLPADYWYVLLAIFSFAAALSIIKPRSCRGWYRLSLYLGFHFSRIIGWCALMLFFILILTPAGFAMRCLGKDLLSLKPQKTKNSYWHSAKKPGPLDQLF